MYCILKSGLCHKFWYLSQIYLILSLFPTQIHWVFFDRTGRVVIRSNDGSVEKHAKLFLVLP